MGNIEQKIIVALLNKAITYALEPGKDAKWLDGYTKGVRDAANVLEEMIDKKND